jgi:signal transduction histidine kinase
MKIRVKKKLTYKFLAFLLPFIIISITITGLVLSITSDNFFQKTIDQDYRNIIRSSAGEIQMFMDSARNNLESLALIMSAAGLTGWNQHMALTAFLHNNPQFVSLSLYSTEKKLLETTVLDSRSQPVPDKAVFEQALSGQSATSGVMIAGEDLPVVHIGIPVRRQGLIREVLWAELSLKSIWDVLDGIRVGKNGQVHIMDLSGRTIAHRDIDRVVKTIPPEIPGIVDTLRASSQPVAWTETGDGKQIFNLGLYVSGLDWIIVLSQPRREIFAYLYRNFLWATAVTVGLCLIAAIYGWIWISRLLSPVRRLHGQVRAIGAGDLDQKVSIATEDEIGELGRAFNDMTDSLKAYLEREVETARKLMHAQNLAVLGTASSKVTHEVGNFLNNADIALAGMKKESLSPRGEKILQILARESARVKAFIQRFLQFARRPDLQARKMSLEPIIKEVVEAFQPTAEAQNIRFELNWPESLPAVNIDAGMMGQVLHNLIRNGLEAMTQPGRIAVSGRVEAQSLILTVSDTGSGMDEAVRARIFEPFYTTKGAGGTGLGMAIVKTIVQAHRGSIDCSSSPGEGTRFEISLPLE